MTLVYWLELIIAYLINRFGREVLGWTLQQVVDYFREHPSMDKECQDSCREAWREPPDDGSGPYFWERKN